ncbi:DUF454 domain-containing protein [Bacillus sp. HMF5848]|uniref:YbaN family protein n=1 Tax=Bacillus sp. HMF5848 TaxID=2495421 RepID=UPI000F7B7D3A|nr:YbaN family protein [Bacillus sp. HMF5848]RSK25648.1 DUF454 domain-containing protein [Bacillus sp. HMF5848]
MNRIKKFSLLVLGTVCIIIGAIGIVLPLIPTTPLLLLGSFCYVRSSEKLHKRLLDNKVLGTFIRDFQEKKGIRLRDKIVSIAVLWTSILFSVFFFINFLVADILLITLAAIISTVIFSFKTIHD